MIGSLLIIVTTLQWRSDRFTTHDSHNMAVKEWLDHYSWWSQHYSEWVIGSLLMIVTTWQWRSDRVLTHDCHIMTVNEWSGNNSWWSQHDSTVSYSIVVYNLQSLFEIDLQYLCISTAKQVNLNIITVWSQHDSEGVIRSLLVMVTTWQWRSDRVTIHDGHSMRVKEWLGHYSWCS